MARDSIEHNLPGPFFGKGLLRNRVFHVFLICLTGLAVYSNTFTAPFQWDEYHFLIANPLIKNLEYFISPSRAAHSEYYMGLVGRYVGYLSFALNYHFHGFDVVGYHIVNFLIHIGNALSLYILVILTFRTPYFRWHSAKGIAQRATDKDPATPQSAKDNNPPLSPLKLRGDEGGLRFRIQDSRYLIALFTSLLFVAHPVQIEAVTYVFQRFASLVALFYLLSIIMYVKGRLKLQTAESIAHGAKREEPDSPYVRRKNALSAVPYALCSLLFAVLAMKTKENAFTLPLVIILYDFLFFNGPIRKRILYAAPLLLTMAIIPLTLVGVDRPLGKMIGAAESATRGATYISRSSYLYTQFRVILTYLRLLAFPMNQDIDYSYPVYHSLWQPPVLLSAILLLSLLGLAGYLLRRSRGPRAKGTEHGAESKAHRAKGKEQQAGKPASGKQKAEDSNPPLSPLKLRGDEGGGCFPDSQEPGLLADGSPRYALCSMPFAYYRLISFGILWFFITLSVESSIIPIPMLIDEYRVYLSSAGMFLAAVVSIYYLAGRSTRKSAHKIAVLFLAVVVVLYATAAYTRNETWGSRLSLWQDAAAKSPHSVVPHFVLGRIYQSEGNLGRAEEQYEIVLLQKPDEVDTRINLGSIYKSEGKIDKAIEQYDVALRLKPGDAITHNNLGDAYRIKGLYNRALDQFLTAVRLNPYLAEAYFNIGLLYIKKGDLDRGRAALEKGLKLKPDDHRAARLLKSISR